MQTPLVMVLVCQLNKLSQIHEGEAVKQRKI